MEFFYFKSNIYILLHAENHDIKGLQKIFCKHVVAKALTVQGEKIPVTDGAELWKDGKKKGATEKIKKRVHGLH